MFSQSCISRVFSSPSSSDCIDVKSISSYHWMSKSRPTFGLEGTYPNKHARRRGHEAEVLGAQGLVGHLSIGLGPSLKNSASSPDTLRHNAGLLEMELFCQAVDHCVAADGVLRGQPYVSGYSQTVTEPRKSLNRPWSQRT